MPFGCFSHRHSKYGLRTNTRRLKHPKGIAHVAPFDDCVCSRKERSLFKKQLELAPFWHTEATLKPGFPKKFKQNDQQLKSSSLFIRIKK